MPRKLVASPKWALGARRSKRETTFGARLMKWAAHPPLGAWRIKRKSALASRPHIIFGFQFLLNLSVTNFKYDVNVQTVKNIQSITVQTVKNIQILFVCAYFIMFDDTFIYIQYIKKQKDFDRETGSSKFLGARRSGMRFFVSFLLHVGRIAYLSNLQALFSLVTWCS